MARMFLLTIFLFAFAVVTATTTTTTSAASADEIISLPGWIGSFPSKQYSGYLDGGNGKHLHYWFVESEGNPSKDPVVLWFNGGPGCSSLDGFFYEHGPWMLSDDGTTLSIRPYRWNRLANVLYIESPVGVGFSYNDNPNGYHSNDDSTAQDSKNAMESFYQKFPQYLSNQFYITGESYAGIYVPMLAYTILQAQAKGQYTGAAITGIAVGNGCTGKDIGVCGYDKQRNYLCDGLYYHTQFFNNLAFTEPELKTAIELTCHWNLCFPNGTTGNGLSSSVLGNDCLLLIDYAMYFMGKDINVYNVYGKCHWFSGCDDGDEDSNNKRIADNNNNNNNKEEGEEKKGSKLFRNHMSPLMKPKSFHTNQLNPYHGKFSQQLLALQQQQQQQQQREKQNFLPDYVNPVVDDDHKKEYQFNFDYGPSGCMDEAAASIYLMNEQVQQAIHVKPIDFCWGVCSSNSKFKYTPNQPNLPRDIYPLLLSHLKVLIYNGDHDACVPFTDNQAWTERMGFTTTKSWRPWTFVDEFNSTQVGGYAVNYNVSHLSHNNNNNSSKNSFEFRTVRGAGHMVPTDTPEQGLAILAHLLHTEFDTVDVVYVENNNGQGVCATDLLVSEYYRERSVLVTTATLVGLLLVLIVCYLAFKINKLQATAATTTRRSPAEFSPMTTSTNTAVNK